MANFQIVLLRLYKRIGVTPGATRNSLKSAFRKSMDAISPLPIQMIGSHVGGLRAERGAEAEAQPFAAAEVLVFEARQQPFPHMLDKREDSGLKFVLSFR